MTLIVTLLFTVPPDEFVSYRRERRHKPTFLRPFPRLGNRQLTYSRENVP